MSSVRQQPGPMSSKSMTYVAFLLVIVVGVVVIGAISLPGVPSMVPIGGTLVGSGHLVTKQENFAGFTAVTISTGFKFTITQSASYSVNVTIDDNLLSYVQASQSGSTLSISLGPAFGQSYQSPHPSVAIAVPDLTQVTISQGSNGAITGFNLSHDFSITASQGCTASMTGSVNNLTVGASTGSHLDLSSVHAANANVNLGTGSQATVRVDGRLDATVTDGSLLTYLGNPTLGTINTSGGGTIAKG